MGNPNIQNIKYNYTIEFNKASFMIHDKIDMTLTLESIIQRIRTLYLHKIVDFIGGPGYVYDIGITGNLFIYTYDRYYITLPNSSVTEISPATLTEEDRETFALFIMKR